MSEDQVLVVGAGPTGLALAAQLAAFGTPVRVVERRIEDQLSRAFVVQPRTLEVLAPIGLSERLVDRGDPDARVRMRAGGRAATVSLVRPDLPDTAYPYLLAIPQVEVERVLEEHLAERGVRVERGTALESLGQDEEGVSCRLRHADGRSEECRAGWVAGCDGADSTVRRQIGVGFPVRTYRTRLLLADVDMSGDLEPGEIQVLVEPAGAMFLFPFPKGDGWRLLAVVEPGDEGVPDRRLVETVVRRSSGGGMELGDVRWVRRVELRRGQAPRYLAGRVLLAGDAAHVHSPAGAQGMNTGIQDAVNLGWKLALAASGQAGGALLDSYQAERWPVARWTRRVTDVGFFLEMGGGWPLERVRRRLVPLLVPLVHRRRMPAAAFRLLAGLSTHYGEGAMIEEGRPALRGGVGAGARLPDGEVGSDGLRLHDRLHPPGFHVLVVERGGSGREVEVPEGIGPVPVSVHRLSDVSAAGARRNRRGSLFDRLGVRDSALYLVRPDGYVGYRCRGTEAEGLVGHLDGYRTRSATAVR